MVTLRFKEEVLSVCEKQCNLIYPSWCPAMPIAHSSRLWCIYLHLCYNEGKWRSAVLKHYSAAMFMSSRNTVSATLWISLILALISKGVCWIALCIGDCWVHRVWLWNMPTLLLVHPGILHKKLWKNSHSQKLFVEMKQNSTNEKNTFTDKHHIPSIW